MFVEEEKEVSRSLEKLTSLRSHSQHVMKLGFEPRSASKSSIFSIYLAASNQETGGFILVLPLRTWILVSLSLK